MTVLPNAVKRTLKAGGVAIGTMISACRNPSIAQMVATAGFQWICVDTEHGGFSPESQTDIFCAARGAGITPVVRVPGTLRTQLSQPLDAGAQGLLIPQVEDPEEVRHIVHATKYAPLGQRGMSLRQAHTEFRKGKGDEVIRALNEETLIIIQIESLLASQRCEELITIPGIDAAFVGPNDLSQTLGVPGQVKHPAVEEQILHVIEVCNKHGVAPGLHCYDIESACQWLSRGIRLMLYCNDVSFIVDGGTRAMNELNTFLQR